MKTQKIKYTDADVIALVRFWKALENTSDEEIKKLFKPLRQNPKYGSRSMGRNEMIVALSIKTAPWLADKTSEKRLAALLSDFYSQPPLSHEELLKVMVRGKQTPNGKTLRESVDRIIAENS